MKLHKIFMLLLTVILLTSALSVLCSAKSPSELAKEYAAEYSDEMEAINEFVGDKADAYSQSLASLSQYSDGEEHTPEAFLINADTAYPYFYYKTTRIDGYTDFASHIERYSPGHWIVENENGIQQFMKENGKLVEGGSGGNMVYTDKNGNPIEVSFSINGTAEYLSDKFADVDEYKIVGFPYGAFTVTLIYVRSENEEYAIPFFGRPEWADFENGKVYKLKELLNIIAPDLDLTSGLDPDGFKLNTDSQQEPVGAGLKTDKSDAASIQPGSKDHTAVYITVCAAIIFIIAIVCAVIIKHKKS